MCHSLSNNYSLCVKGLQGLHKRLRQDPSLLEAYDKVIKEQLELGTVKKVPESEALGRIHYLPHHLVVREDKTTSKVRVIYDASSFEGDSASLNQCLHISPSFNQSVLDILIWFRAHPVDLHTSISKGGLSGLEHPPSLPKNCFFLCNLPKKNKTLKTSELTFA